MESAKFVSDTEYSSTITNATKVTIVVETPDGTIVLSSKEPSEVKVNYIKGKYDITFIPPESESEDQNA